MPSYIPSRKAVIQFVYWFLPRLCITAVKLTASKELRLLPLITLRMSTCLIIFSFQGASSFKALRRQIERLCDPPFRTVERRPGDS